MNLKRVSSRILRQYLHCWKRWGYLQDKINLAQRTLPEMVFRDTRGVVESCDELV